MICSIAFSSHFKKGPLHNYRERCASKPKMPCGLAPQNTFYFIPFDKIHPSKPRKSTTNEDLPRTIPIG
jgi:hypothetical protein